MVEPQSADRIKRQVTKKASVSPQIKLDANNIRNQMSLSFSAISSGTPNNEHKDYGGEINGNPIEERNSGVMNMATIKQD